jgi:exonuclease VII large subunit
MSATHAEVLSTAAEAACNNRRQVVAADEKVEQLHRQLKEALQSYDAHACLVQESASVAHLQVCQAQLSKAIDSTHQWLEEDLFVVLRTESQRLRRYLNTR